MKKGFTLIELLAVIVILAIIALIATPIILGIINDVREDSEKRSIENYAHAVELSVARYTAETNGVIPVGIYKTNKEEKTKLDKQSGPGPDELIVDYKGEKIDATVEIISNGEIKITGASIDGGKAIYNYSEKEGVIKIEKSKELSRFKVTKEGVLIHYEKQGDETSVVVPPEVNGIKIKSIAPYAFHDGEILIDEGNGYAIGLDEKYKENGNELANSFGFKFILIDEYLNNESLEPGTFNGKIILDFSNPDVAVHVSQIKSSNYLTYVDLSKMSYLETISKYAFKGYSGYGNEECGNSRSCSLGKLENIMFPNNGVLITIGEEAFSYNNLTALELPNTLENIGTLAFHGNKISGELVIPSTVKIIEHNVFENNQINSLTFEHTKSKPSKLITIGSNAFHGNKISGELIIPSTVKTIEYNAFASNQLDELLFENFDKNLSSSMIIGENAFAWNKISKLTLSASVKTIGNYAFYLNQISGELIIPSSVETIGNYAFAGKEGISKINKLIFEDTEKKPSQLTTIGDYAFVDNQISGELIIPSSVETIGAGSFKNNQISGELVIPSKITIIPNDTFYGNKISKIIVHSGVKTIGDYAFYNTGLIGTIIIPSSVKTIGNYAFYDCPELNKIVFKRLDSSGMTFGINWNYKKYSIGVISYEIVYDPNYVE